MVVEIWLCPQLRFSYSAISVDLSSRYFSVLAQEPNMRVLTTIKVDLWISARSRDRLDG